MGRDWLVVAATGQRLDLKCGLETLEIKRPRDQFAKDMFMQVRVGQSIDDGVVSLFHKGK